MSTKKTFFALAVVAAVGFMSSGVMAADPVPDETLISVTVAEDDVMTAAAVTALGDPKIAGNSAVNAMDMTFSNNNVNGFVITLASKNRADGRLLTANTTSALFLEGTNAGTITDPGRYVAYKIALVKDSGTEGGTVVNDFSTLKFITGVANADEYTITSATKASNDVVYSLNLSTLQTDDSTVGAKDDLFEGVFSDTIVITMADS